MVSALCLCLVTVHGITSDTRFTHIQLLAMDSRGTMVGHWTTDDPVLRMNSCGAVMQNSNVDKNRVQARWHPASNLQGVINIQ